jgi:hypothetical protein
LVFVMVIQSKISAITFLKYRGNSATTPVADSD